MTQWIEELLRPYMARIAAAPGRNGLSRNMNNVLRAHPETVTLIQRTITRLIETELLGDLSGTVGLSRFSLYQTLIQTEDDWNQFTTEVKKLDEVTDPAPALRRFIETGEVPSVAHEPQDTTVIFKRIPEHAYRVFTDAMTIAKRVGLVEGYGKVKLASAFLKRAQKMQAKVG